MLFLKVARRMRSVDSTNAEALRALADNRPPEAGAVFWADHQLNGRGQGTNGWFSSEGANLTLSIVLYPDSLPVEQLFVLTQISALAVADTVKHFLAPSDEHLVRVKWPNDIMVGEKKIAGILVQNGIRGNRVSWSVVGIGLNVNEMTFPADITEKAVSIRQLVGNKVNREAVAEQLFSSFSVTYGLIGQRSADIRQELYHEILFHKDKLSAFSHIEKGEVFRGTLRAVTPDGRILIENAKGDVDSYAFREVRHLF